MAPRWAWLLLALAFPAAAQTVVPVAPVVPVTPLPAGPRGAYLGELTTQARSLLSVPAPLPQAFHSTLLAQPELRTPEAFAARAALIGALAKPNGLKELAQAVQAHDGKKARAAKRALGRLAEAIREAPASERKGLGAEAAALAARFDGTMAAKGEAVDLSAFPTIEDGPGKSKARKELAKVLKDILPLQKQLGQGGVRGVLVVLQGMDGSGKGGVVSRPLRLNPQYTRYGAFKKPTAEEAKRHFLDRVKAKLAPGSGKGFVQIFDRSYYEDLIMPAILESHSPEEIEARYREVVAFERQLAEAGIVVLKVFLHVSPATQEERLEARLEDPKKHVKASAFDWEMSRRFPEFMALWGEAFARTSTPWAPWHVFAADNKPRAELGVARLVLKTLERMGLDWGANPELDEAKRARERAKGSN